MPNLPPSPADFAKLIARVETLERAQPDRAKSKLEQLDDVATPQPATGSSLVFDGVKWVPGSTASGFPVGPEDDTVATHEIQTASPAAGVLKITSVEDAGGVTATYGQTAGYPTADNAVISIIADKTSGSTAQAQMDAAVSSSDVGLITLEATSGVGPSDGLITINAATVSVITISSDQVVIPVLPTSDPANSGQLWNDAGTVKVSP